MSQFSSFLADLERTMTLRPDAVTTDAAPPTRCPGVRCMILQSSRWSRFLELSFFFFLFLSVYPCLKMA